jgi:tetratricopeptide (TPR) repeat protein
MPVTHYCEHCGDEGAALRCGRCREASYCGKDCQRLAWKAGHKFKCVEFTPPTTTAQPPQAQQPQQPTSQAGAGEADEECTICLDVIDDPLTMPCGHRFCRTCITSMRKHCVAEAALCPLCRCALPDTQKLLVEGHQLATRLARWSDKHLGQETRRSLPPKMHAVSERALAQLGQVLTVEPANVGAHLAMSRVLQVSGDLSAAAEHVRRARELARVSGDLSAGARRLEIETLMAHGQLLMAHAQRSGAFSDELEPTFRRVIELRDAELREENETVLCEMNAGRTGRELDESDRLRPEDSHYWAKSEYAEALTMIGVVFQQRVGGGAAGQAGAGRKRALAEAKTLFHRAMAVDSSHFGAAFSLGTLLLYEERDLRGAERALRTAIAAKPDYANAHLQLANLLKQKRDFTGCLDAYRAVCALDPNAVDGWEGVAHLAGLVGRAQDDEVYVQYQEESIAAYRRMVNLLPAGSSRRHKAEEMLRMAEMLEEQQYRRGVTDTQLLDDGVAEEMAAEGKGFDVIPASPSRAHTAEEIAQVGAIDERVNALLANARFLEMNGGGGEAKKKKKKKQKKKGKKK